MRRSTALVAGVAVDSQTPMIAHAPAMSTPSMARASAIATAAAAAPQATGNAAAASTVPRSEAAALQDRSGAARAPTKVAHSVQGAAAATALHALPQPHQETL